MGVFRYVVICGQRKISDKIKTVKSCVLGVGAVYSLTGHLERLLRYQIQRITLLMNRISDCCG